MESEYTFVKVLETHSLTDIAIIKSILDGGGIRYFFQGEHIAVIRPIEPAVLLVAREDVIEAIDLLKDLDLKYVRMDFDPGHEDF